jgi:transcriptional regulator with XRE-family HTH domain
MESKKEIFGKRLKSLRNKKGENQEDTAAAIGISRSRYSHYENNHVEPDMGLIRKFANYFNVRTDYLLGQTDNPDPEENKEFDSLAEVRKVLDEFGIPDIFFHDMEDWKNLTPEDIEELRNHFKYIVHKSKERKK